MEQEYDFYELGKKYAEETSKIFFQKVEEIGRRFGEEAQKDFASGYTITRKELEKGHSDLEELEQEHAEEDIKKQVDKYYDDPVSDDERFPQ